MSGIAQRTAHRHNFHEIFWVEEGEGVHVINGRQRELRPGICFCIRASDSHSLRARPDASLRIINIAFASRSWQALWRRCFHDRPDFFAGPASGREFDLQSWLPGELATAADDLGQGPRTRLKIERFLINFFYRLAEAGTREESPMMPDWLEAACRRIQENMAFAGGVPALARLAGRCPEHVAREARRCLHRTPTDIVNAARLAYAAVELTNGRRSIADIALACGIENLSHFYNLFRHRFGCTPRQHRLRHQRIVNWQPANPPHQNAG